MDELGERSLFLSTILWQRSVSSCCSASKDSRSAFRVSRVGGKCSSPTTGNVTTSPSSSMVVLEWGMAKILKTQSTQPIATNTVKPWRVSWKDLVSISVGW